uniref:Uncharacterized protein n=1 Tax=Arundo donax TaxID=35708 RepID=A0A0A9EAD1_ARUDO
MTCPEDQLNLLDVAPLTLNQHHSKSHQNDHRYGVGDYELETTVHLHC